MKGFKVNFSGSIFLLLLFFGSLDHSDPNGLLWRIGYLIIIPLLTFLLLIFIWERIDISYILENVLNGVLWIIISLSLIVAVFFELKNKSHLGNTEWVRTTDEMIPIGDEVLIKGPDMQTVYILLLIALVLLWLGIFSIRKRFDYAE